MRGARTREKGEREGKEGEERKKKQIKIEIRDVDRQREGSDHVGGDLGASRLVRTGSLKCDN